MQHEELATLIQKGAEEIGKGFTEPDDDWSVAGFIDSEEGLIVVALQVDKAQWMPAMATLIRENKATMVGMIHSTWMVVVQDHERELAGTDDWPRPSQHPNRKEALWIIVTDGKVTRGWQNMIERHDDAPPTLEGWEEQDGGSIAGAQVEPLVEALQ